MLRLAIEVVKLLAPYTTRIAVAGSLRRGKALVGDIEIVCQPDEQFLPTGGKGFIEIRQNGLNWRCNRLREKQIFEPRLNSNGNPQSWGDQQKWFRYQGVNVDLYAVLPGYSWGREMVIRTGPGDANGVLVTNVGARNRDGHWGVLPKQFKFQNRELYVGDMCIPTPEEKDVFAALDMPYIPPPLRSVEMYQRWAARRALRELPTPKAESPRLMMAQDSRFGDDIWLPVATGDVARVDPQPRFLNVRVGLQEKVAS